MCMLARSLSLSVCSQPRSPPQYTHARARTQTESGPCGVDSCLLWNPSKNTKRSRSPKSSDLPSFMCSPDTTPPHLTVTPFRGRAPPPLRPQPCSTLGLTFGNILVLCFCFKMDMNKNRDLEGLKTHEYIHSIACSWGYWGLLESIPAAHKYIFWYFK